MLFPTLIIFSFQACIYARSIHSDTLNQLVNTGIREDRPVIIIIDPGNRLQLPEFRTDDTMYKKKEDAVYSKKFSALRIRAEKNVAEDFLQALRQNLKGKCDDLATCKEVIWEVAEKLTGTTVTEPIKREYDSKIK